MKTAVLFGKGSNAIYAGEVLLNLGYNIKAVVPVLPEPTWTDSLCDWAGTKKLEVVKISDLDQLPLSSADLGLSVFYDKIFKQRHIDIFRKLVNVHNAPLPKYRGVAPINWALKNGESIHGVTIHDITEGIDQGDIYAQVTYPIWPEHDSLLQALNRGLLFGRSLIEETLPRIWEVTPRKQLEEDASYYSKSEMDKLGHWKSW